MELIPVDAVTGEALPVEPSPERPRATGPFLREVARKWGWMASTSGAGVPGFLLAGGHAVSFEPGGQVELSSAPMASVTDLVDELDGIVLPLVREARDRGIRMICRGMDPVTPVSTARVELEVERYRRMARHYERYGAWGRRMMCRTAAVHVNLDLDGGLERWRLANRLVPPLAAALANSPRAEGSETGHRSWRAAQWRRLDPTRTGVFGESADPVADYLEFALGAEAFLLGAEGEAEAFRSWLDRGTTGYDWRRHLSTLFPEVRPRGYLEVRAFDALPPRWYAVPLVLLAGALYDPEARGVLLESLPAATPGRMERAGRRGVRDPELAREAGEVFEAALAGARRLGPEIVAPRVLEVVEAFRTRFTDRGRDPGDEPGDAVGEGE